MGSPYSIKRLDRYIMAQIAVPSVLALGVISFLAVANEIRERLDEMPVDLITLADVSKMTFFFLPSLVAYVLPITFLMGILMTFGRLAQQGEITAMRAAGIPLKRIVAPVIVTGALLSVAAFVIQDRVQPWAIERAFALIYSELPQRVTLDVLPAGQMHEYEGWRVYFGRKDPDTLTLYDIDLVRPEKEGGVSVFHAESAQFRQTDTAHELVLTKGNLITPQDLRLSFESQRLTIPKPSPSKARGMRRAQDLAGLLARSKQLRAEYRETHSQAAKQALKKERREIGERVSMPFACLAVAFLGAPLAARARRAGRSYTFAVGFTIILVYYVLQMLMEPSSLHSQGDIILRAWTPNLVLLLTGAALLWRVDRV